MLGRRLVIHGACSRNRNGEGAVGARFLAQRDHGVVVEDAEVISRPFLRCGITARSALHA